MKYNTQNNPKWKNQIMTKSDTWTDTLSQYGCLVSCLANIFQIIMNKVFTPKDMNDLIKQVDGYLYLNDKNTPENMASIIMWDRISQVSSKTISISTRISKSLYKNDTNMYFIAKVKYNGSPTGFHYMNVLGKSSDYFVCFDVYNGEVVLYKEADIIYFHKIERI